MLDQQIAKKNSKSLAKKRVYSNVVNSRIPEYIPTWMKYIYRLALMMSVQVVLMMPVQSMKIATLKINTLIMNWPIVMRTK